MAGNVIKSAIGTFAVLIISTGSAFAQDANLIDKIYAQIESGKSQTFEIVSTTANDRVAKTIEVAHETQNSEASTQPSAPQS